MRRCCSTCRSASMTTSWPTRAPQRRRSTSWSRIGKRCSRTKVRSSLNELQVSRPLVGGPPLYRIPIREQQVSHEHSCRQSRCQDPTSTCTAVRRDVRQSNCLAVHYPVGTTAAGDQHFPAAVDDPALVHQLSGQSSECRAEVCR